MQKNSISHGDSSRCAPDEHWKEMWLLDWDASRAEPSIDRSPHLEVLTAPGLILAMDGVLFDNRTLGDVASLYARGGTACFGELRGSFLIAIFDTAKRRVVVGRDAMGLTSAYFTRLGRRLLVSSLVDPILAAPGVSRAVNRATIAEYLLGKQAHRQIGDTCFADVRRLPPAHHLTFDGDRLDVTRYWDPLPPGFSWASREETDSFTPTLERAVSRCLEGGANSLALSGGFDSVSLAVVAARQLRGKRPLHAFSVLFPHPSCDEEETQIAVARALEMPQTLKSIDESLGGANCLEATLEFSVAMPSPAVNLWHSIFSALLRSAREMRLRGLLMGLGGDDMFSVDPTHAADCVAHFDMPGLWRYFNACRRWSSYPPWAVARSMVWNGLRPVLGRLVSDTMSRIAPRMLDTLRTRAVRPLPRWVAPALGEDLRSRRGTRSAPTADGWYVQAMRELVLSPYLLTEQDQGFVWGRSHGLRIFAPYFDRDLVGLLLRMRPAQLIAGGRAKAPLRRLVAERLPQVPMRPRKVNFVKAVDSLLRTHGPQVWKRLGGPMLLAEAGVVVPDLVNLTVEGYLEGRNNDWSTAWRILSAESWLRAWRR